MLGTSVSAWREHRDYAPLDWVRHLESGDPRHQIYEDLTYGPLSQMPALRFWPIGRRLDPRDIPPALQDQATASAISPDVLWVHNGAIPFPLSTATGALWLSARKQPITISAIENALRADSNRTVLTDEDYWPLSAGAFLPWPLLDGALPWPLGSAGVPLAQCTWDNVAVECRSGFPNPAPDLFPTDLLTSRRVLLAALRDRWREVTGVAEDVAAMNLSHVFSDAFWESETVTPYLLTASVW